MDVAYINRREEQLLTKIGGRYVIRKQIQSQWRTFASLIIWGAYVFIAADLGNDQIYLFLASILGLTFIVNIILTGITFLATRIIRHRIDQTLKIKTLPLKTPLGDIQTRAWKDLINLPGVYAIASLVLIYLLVVLPTWSILIRNGDINNLQAVIIIVGGFFSGGIAVFSGVLSFDRMLTPVRHVLLPENPGDQNIDSGIMWITPRLSFLIPILVLGTILMMGTIGYAGITTIFQQKEVEQIPTQIITDTLLIGAILLGTSIILMIQVAKSIHQPINELIHSIDDFRSGKMLKRKLIPASDEAGHLTIQFYKLLDHLQAAQSSFEHEVDSRTSELTRKTLQLQASAQVAREAAALQDVELLISKTVDMVAELFHFYHAGLFLLDDLHEYAVLRAASSAGGKKLIANGFRLPVGRQGIIGSVAYENRAHVAMDVSQDTMFVTNSELILTRSEASFPLTVRNEVIGVLDIQADSLNVFAQSDIELLQALSDQVALAIHNARLIAETRDALSQLESSNIRNIRHTWSEERRKPQRYRYTPLGVEVDLKVAAGKVERSHHQINIPISLRGQKIGTITIHRKDRSSPWTEADRSLAVDVANQIGLALENARLLDSSQQRAIQEQTISKISSLLSRSLDPNSLLQTAIKELHQLPDVEEVSVFIGSMESTSPE